ncbi:hypothetical protein D0Z00_001770 [Geotrichum galactomycetum]|uniref:Uncharacterized protein n=1 Tax=Geotrichum galactomycetum TaxID=27317 RepID=A0ACB6V601_9ASCO|nr:hypothetical protein D0Z00_001770 [Geotrichum candidum]
MPAQYHELATAESSRASIDSRQSDDTYDNSEEHHLLDAFDGSDSSDSDSDSEDDRNIEMHGTGNPQAGAYNLAPEQQQNLTSTSAASSSSAPLSSAGSNSASLSRPSRLFNNLFSWRRHNQRPSLVNENDGVFANLSAKPERETDNEDFPPTYEEAAQDQTPPYWMATVMTPGFADEIFVEGLPVGSPINFAWNMMVSSAFQFIGFLLTYLLHTSHAAKQGSRAGLGFTLFQFGFYLRPSPAEDASANPVDEFHPNEPNNYNVNSASDGFSQNSSVSNTHSTSTSWIAIFLMTVGALMIIRAILDYSRARKMELVILGPATTVVVPDEEETEPTRIV